MPVEGLKLVVEPRHPLYEWLNGSTLDDSPKQEEEPPHIYQSGDRKLRPTEVQAILRYKCWLNTLAIAADETWSIEAEAKAMTKLQELTTKQAFKCYFLGGTFLETSPRSRIVYMFRKLRPTIALRQMKDGNFYPIAALCLHPIGHYEESWAGVMVPTDDVIAHLLLMRGDERRFWGKANHHPIDKPQSGI